MTAALSIGGHLAQPDFDVLYEEHLDGVWRLLEGFGVPESALDDAAQEVFLIAHRRLGAFRGDSSLKTWLGGIAVRVAKDFRRSGTRTARNEPLEDHVDHLQSPSQPEETAGQRQALAHILRLLEELDDDQRTVLVFADFEGMTAPEIAPRGNASMTS